MDKEKLIKDIIKSAYDVRKHFMAGYLESVYRNALVVDLKSKGLNVRTEMPIEVRYKNELVGEFRADIVVEDLIIIELKSVNNLLPIHEAQLVNYLVATGIEDGLLINFGGDKIDIKRKYKTYKKN